MSRGVLGDFQDERSAHFVQLSQAELSEAWRLRRLPQISLELEASQTAALQKKAQLDQAALWRSYIGGKIVFSKLRPVEEAGEAQL